jgi:catalase
MSADERDRLIQTIAKNLGSATSREVKVLETKQFYRADPDYGSRVAKALDIEQDEIK